METGGWILLGTSWATLSALVYFCIRRVLRGTDGPTGTARRPAGAAGAAETDPPGVAPESTTD